MIPSPCPARALCEKWEPVFATTMRQNKRLDQRPCVRSQYTTVAGKEWAIAQTHSGPEAQNPHFFVALPVFRGDGQPSGDQCADQCPEESFSCSACVVGELEKGEVDRQFFL
ncbi:hypothetical protein GCM10027396_19060 [Insolitispirillum peregrinum]